MREKLKSWLSNDQLFYTILVLLVGILSFWLGQSSVASNQSEVVTATRFTANKVELVSSTPLPEGSVPSDNSVAVVASKSGTKYHLPSCPGASQIKPENQIYFASVAEAVAAGYTPAANCPGLK